MRYIPSVDSSDNASFGNSSTIAADRRNGIEAVPLDFYSYLTDAQYIALSDLEAEGWAIFAIRRIGIIKPVVIMHHKVLNFFRQLLEHGAIASQEIPVRR